MKNHIIIAVLIILGGLFLSSPSYGQDDDKYYLVGPSNHEILFPEKVTYAYLSGLFENEIFKVEYDGEKKSFHIFSKNQEIKISDPVFADLKISPYGFDLEEYLNNLGTDDPPLKCQTLYFVVIENPHILTGSYGMCEGEKPRLRLKSNTEHPLDSFLTVYDSSISDKIHLDGFWEEIFEDEIE